MAYPYRGYIDREGDGNPGHGNASTGINHYPRYGGNYEPISTAGWSFVGGFIAIVALISLVSWLKTKWYEQKWSKEWDKAKHQKELDEREKNSEGINTFGWEGNTRTGKVSRKKPSNRHLKLDPPDEAIVEVRNEKGKIVSEKKVRSEVQLLELTSVLGLSFPEDCIITIKTKTKKAGDKGV